MREFNPLTLVFLKARKGDTERFLEHSKAVEEALRTNGMSNDEFRRMAIHTKRSNDGVITFVSPSMSEEDLAMLDQYDMVLRSDYVVVNGTFVKSRSDRLLYSSVF